MAKQHPRESLASAAKAATGPSLLELVQDHYGVVFNAKERERWDQHAGKLLAVVFAAQARQLFEKSADHT